ncbi:DUF833 domain protein [Talaromyces stipitatus ATCC 10500]|uniref:DUF833 domain protein n=1 Tax=Talaromyces stipitatus (strain ATCC 10500 / CBS 375.48 / QM 6759 / NRRL 1006) TaxID=441959 RepID=B8MCA0_TALSN|nr:DUF833 domain protein [Talaromyces stipitatus ATCC 10500]EED18547.1 DUF833 domain protein [Talaromyces stipitatus ATCC 10500]
MCIALISTAHPAYELIIIDNRDEYLHRPTAPANWWQSPNTHVLGSRDLARPEQGTWMGVTRQGRVAVLTNYREASPVGSVSRGAIVNDFLTETGPAHLSGDRNGTGKEKEKEKEKENGGVRTTRAFVQDMINSQIAAKAGGFSLVCGRIGEPLAIISNRMSDNIDSVTWIASTRGETVGLSNTFLKDRTWPKIINGEILTREAIDSHIAAYPHTHHHPTGGEEEADLIQRLFQVLSTNTMPYLSNTEPVKEQYMNQLKESIFIPLLGDRPQFEAEEEHLAHMGLAGYMTGLYGTQKQTVLLVDFNGRVKYVERTLYDEHVHPIPLGEGDRVFEFVIEGWEAKNLPL